MGKLRLIFALILLLNSTLLFSQNIEYIKLLKEGRNYLYRGEEGNKKAVKKATKILEKAVKLDPENAIARAFLGTAYNLKSRDASMPWNKMKWVKKGIALLDMAVEKNSKNIWVRLERGSNSLELPAFFNRLPVAKKDFDFLVNCIETEPDSFILNAEGTSIYLEKGENEKNFVLGTRQVIYYKAGKVYYQLSDIKKATELWKKAVALGTGTKYGKKAQKELNNLEE